MKIRRYKGITRLNLGIDIPADKKISDLPKDIQEKIKTLGEFKDIGIIDTEHKETVDRIANDGFFLWKATVEYTEHADSTDDKII